MRAAAEARRRNQQAGSSHEAEQAPPTAGSRFAHRRLPTASLQASQLPRTSAGDRRPPGTSGARSMQSSRSVHPEYDPSASAMKSLLYGGATPAQRRQVNPLQPVDYEAPLDSSEPRRPTQSYTIAPRVMVPVAEDEPFGDPRLGLSSNMLRVHHPYGEPTQPYRRQEPPRGTGTAGDMAGAPTGLPLGPALRPWPEDAPSHRAPQSPMLQPWQQQQHQQQQQQQQHLQQQLQQQQQVIDALCAQVSTLTALLQPGGPSGVTLAQRVDYLEADVAELRSQLAPQGGGGQWRPARSYAR